MAEEVKKNDNGVGGTLRRLDDLSVTALPGSKWQSFKNTFGIRLTRVIAASFFCLMFCSPAIVWIVMFGMYFVQGVGSSLPFGIHDGLGYIGPDVLADGLNSAFIQGNIKYYEYAVMQYSVLIPLIMIGALGVGGLAYVARMAMYGEEFGVIRTFFSGVAKTWRYSLIGGALIGGGLLLVMFCFYAFDAAAFGGPVNLGAKIVTIILSILLLVILSIYSFYLVTMACNYKTRFFHTLRDAWAFTFMRLPVNLLGCVFVAIIVGASIGLIAGLGQSFAVIVWALLFFFGFYAVTGIFTVFAHASFDKMVTEGLLDRENRAAAREAYAAIRAKKAAGLVPAKKKQEPAKFVNPKKKKKSESTDKATVHENMTPSPAPAAKKIKGGYTAADLERLEADRAKVKAEAENNASSDDIEDMSIYEDDGE